MRPLLMLLCCPCPGDQGAAAQAAPWLSALCLRDTRLAEQRWRLWCVRSWPRRMSVPRQWMPSALLQRHVGAPGVSRVSHLCGQPGRCRRLLTQTIGKPRLAHLQHVSPCAMKHTSHGRRPGQGGAGTQAHRPRRVPVLSLWLTPTSPPVLNSTLCLVLTDQLLS